MMKLLRTALLILFVAVVFTRAGSQVRADGQPISRDCQETYYTHTDVNDIAIYNGVVYVNGTFNAGEMFNYQFTTQGGAPAAVYLNLFKDGKRVYTSLWQSAPANITFAFPTTGTYSLRITFNVYRPQTTYTVNYHCYKP